MVIVALVATTSTVWAQERPTNKLHRVSFNNVGTSFTDEKVIGDIVAGTVKKPAVGRRHLGVSAADTSSAGINGALVKDREWREIAFNGALPEEAVAVKVVIFPNGLKHVYPARRVQEYRDDWWLVIHSGNLDDFEGSNGIPQVEFRVFDPATGELTVMSSPMSFWIRPEYGIRDVHIDKNDGLIIAAMEEFGQNTKVWINNYHGEVPEEALWLGWNQIEVDLEFLRQKFYSGPNLVTIVDADGRCDTYPYLHTWAGIPVPDGN